MKRKMRIVPGGLGDPRVQALHAMKLTLVHPMSGTRMQWTADVPPDMSRLMEALAKDAKTHHS